MNRTTPSGRRVSMRWPWLRRHRRRVSLCVAALLVASGLATAAWTVPGLLSDEPSATSSSSPRTSADSSPVTLGADFTATGAVTAVGVRFFKAAANTGDHTGALWDSSGAELATATFVDESTTGWQHATFATPVALHAGARYTVSYFAPHGRYSYAHDVFVGDTTQQFRSTAETRGTYHYGAAVGLPTSTYRAASYYVAPILSGDGAEPPPTTAVPPVAGTPDGQRLTPMGATTISRADTVIDARSITGQIVIDAPNVTISRSRLDGTGRYGIQVVSGSVRIVDTTITGFRFGVVGDDYRADGVEVTGLSDDGFVLGSHTLVENSWCHEMEPEPGAHADCAQMQSGEVDVAVRNSYLDVGSGLGNSAVFLAPDLGPDSQGPVAITGNVLGGGNYTLYCLDGRDGTYVTGGITIEGNRFLDTARYGPMDITVPATVSDNTFAATGRPVLP